MKNIPDNKILKVDLRTGGDQRRTHQGAIKQEVYWYQKAAAQAIVPAMFELGFIFEFGSGDGPRLSVVLKVVVALECGCETYDVNPVFLLCVMPGLLDLADYAGVHQHLLPNPRRTRSEAKKSGSGY